MRIIDWSSDVCSSDLVVLLPDALAGEDAAFAGQRDLASNEQGRFALYWSQSQPGRLVQEVLSEAQIIANDAPAGSEPANAWYVCPQTQESTRSEEVRGGKERVRTCRSRWSPDH